MSYQILSRNTRRWLALGMMACVFVWVTGCDEEEPEPEEESSGPMVSLEAEVIDAFGQPLAGATVATVDEAVSVETDEEGRFLIEVEGPEVPDLEIYKEGHTMETVEAVPMRSDTGLMRYREPRSAVTLYPVPEEKGAYRIGDEELESLPVTTLGEGDHPEQYELKEEDIQALTLPAERHRFIFVDLPFANAVSVEPSTAWNFGQGGVTLRSNEDRYQIRGGEWLTIDSFSISPGQWALVSMVPKSEGSVAKVAEDDVVVLFTAE